LRAARIRRAATAFAREGQAPGAVYPAPLEVVDQVRGAVLTGAQTSEGELDVESAITRASALTGNGGRHLLAASPGMDIHALASSVR
jgi:hypothetical protein